ncbi:MAG: FG-GAP-like repeat-containing protein [Sandaracinaceae bacterium]|nr:FG-GAP-like repeat-containing protein [Sandaracinaceae bacterium]
MRACTTAGACADWSEVRFLDVGRVYGDLNGDGRSEVVAGHREDVGANMVAGRVRVYPGQAGMPGPATTTIDGTEAMAETGAAIASGDFDGNGFADLVIGVPRQDAGGSPNAGQVLLLLGGPSGVIPATALEIVSPSRQSAGLFGSSISAGCDFDADGYGDFAVGAPSENDGSIAGAGRVYVFYGGPSGLAARPAQGFRSPTPMMAGSFGTSVSLMADMDGDGKCDLVIGSRESSGGVSRAGRAYVAFASRWDQLEPLDSTSPESSGLFSDRVAVSDIDGDGFADLLASAMNEDVPGNQDAGIVHVFFGARGTPLAHIALASPEERGFGGFGSQLAVGDVTGDGVTDALVFGLQETATGLPVRAGRVHVFAGGSRTPSAITLANPPSAIGFGAALGTRGDSDGDGVADIAIGSSSGCWWLAGSSAVESVAPVSVGPAGASIAALAP